MYKLLDIYCEYLWYIHTQKKPSRKNNHCQKNVTKIAKSSTQKLAKGKIKVTLQNPIWLPYPQKLWIIASWSHYATGPMCFSLNIHLVLLFDHWSYAMQCSPTKGKPCFKVRIILYGLSFQQFTTQWHLSTSQILSAFFHTFL